VSLGLDCIPIVLVKNYYWCPAQTWFKLHAWSERPTPSMEAGVVAGEYRGRLLELLAGEGLEWSQELWEHPVESKRLGVCGRVDLVQLMDGEAVVVEAKLSTTKHRLRRDPGVVAQVAAYAIAVEETLALPVRRAIIYSVEEDRLYRLEVGPVQRMLGVRAAEELWRLLQSPEPLCAPQRPWRCRLCRYRSECPCTR